MKRTQKTEKSKSTEKPRIFDASILPPLTLMLHTPSQKEWGSTQSMLEMRHDKEELLTLAESFQPWLSQFKLIVRKNDNGDTIEATECTDMRNTTSNKTRIARGIALIVADEQNMQAYIATLSTEMVTLWHMLLANIYVSMATAKKILNTKDDLYIKDRSNYYYYSIYKWTANEYKWFTKTECYSSEPNRWNYRENENYITISTFVRKLFFPYFFPKIAKSDFSMAELPQGQWRTINLEADSQAKFNLFCGLFQQGEFPLKKKGIGLTDLKRNTKKMGLTEFFDDSADDYRKNLRAYFFLQMLALNEHLRPTDKRKQKTTPPTTYQDTLRELITHFDRFNPYLITLFFAHIKGLRKQMTTYSSENTLAAMFFELLRQKPDRWSSISDILLKMGVLESDSMKLRYKTLVFYPGDEYPYAPIVNEYSTNNITAETYTRDFGLCTLQALALMLGSLGMAEVALSTDMHRNLSPFDTAAYIRLTPLGRYALGVINEYEAPQQEQHAYFELDPDRLIIRSLVEPNPYAQLLTDTSVPISKNRFETSARSFLANCHKREDVEQKISIFQRFISNDLPTLWQQFFQQLLQHCHPLKEDKTAYKRYTLNADNHELIQLITTDPQLRQLVIRAEGYRILVKNDDLKKFETQLKKHGYLL